MNSIPVLKSKLIMPELSGSFLLTDRLKRLYDNMDSSRAVTVCGSCLIRENNSCGFIF